MSSPPSAPPPGDGAEPKSPAWAETAWEFHADERILDCAFGADGLVRVVDALANWTLLDARGRPARTVRTGTRARAAAVMPQGGAAIATEDGRLLLIDDEGAVRLETKCEGVASLGATAHGIVVAADHQPVVLLSPSGRMRSSCAVPHSVSHAAPCSPQGHVIALSSTGRFSVLQRGRILWHLDLRSSATALSVNERGTFAIAHRDGAQTFTVDGACLALYQPGPSVRGVALSADGSVLTLLDEGDTLYRVDADGSCTWRARRTRRQAFVRMSKDGTRALAAAAAGAVELLVFERRDDRAQRLEVISTRPAGDGAWRHVTATVEGVAPACRFALAPGGEAVAFTSETMLEVRDAQGGLAARTTGVRDPVGLSFSTDGGFLLAQGARSLVVTSRDGRIRSEITGQLAHVVPGPGARFVSLAAGGAPRVTAHDAGAIAWEAPLPARADRLLAAADMSWVLAVGDGRFTLLDGAGRLGWTQSRPDALGLAAGGPGFVTVERHALVGLRMDGSEAWRVPSAHRLEPCVVGGHVFGRDESNRFWWIAADGGLRPVDDRANLGRSILLEAPASPCGVVELNVSGRVLTAFDLDGRIAWRCEAPDLVSPADVQARSGLLAFRSGPRLCLLRIARGAAEDAAARASFLEV